MTHEDIMKKLAGILRDSSQGRVDLDTVGPDTLISDMGFDSLATLDLIYDIQQGFNTEFDAEEITHIRTLGALVEFLKDKTG